MELQKHMDFRKKADGCPNTPAHFNAYIKMLKISLANQALKRIFIF